MKARWIAIGRLFEKQKEVMILSNGEPGEPGHQLVQLELFLWPWVAQPQTGRAGSAQPQTGQTGSAQPQTGSAQPQTCGARRFLRE